MTSDDKKYDRIRALEKICAVDRYGSLDGVQFDLRHELLDPAEWQTRFPISWVWGDDPYGQRPGLPFIWFPWHGEFNKIALMQQVEDSIKEHIARSNEVLTSTMTRKLRAHYRKDVIPECVVNCGDKIVVESVKRTPIADEFSHLHDSEVRFAYCNVLRQNGKITKISRPITFLGITSVNTKKLDHNEFDRLDHNEFDRIVFRIAKHFGVKSLYDLKWEGGLASAAAYYAKTVLYYSEEALKSIRTLDFDSPDYAKAKSHWESVNRAVLTGYYWARAEAELAMKPLATSALRAKAGATSGGTKSGKTRQRKRAETWEPIAREMAKGIRAENPTFSQDDVATEIDAGWKPTTCDPPGHSTLKGLISRMEQAGELPKRLRT
jgi:hypothetical protein